MTPDPAFFRDLAYVFVAAVVGGGLAWMVRQPLILGYVLGGIVIGPFTPGPVISDIHTFEIFAEIGVVLLMFSIGIEFSFKDLLEVKWVALIGGPIGILLSIGLSVVLGTLIGWPIIQSISIGAIISMASTMVLARLLIDRGELHSRHGRVMIGITLVEDMAVVVMIVLLPALGVLEPGRLLLIGQALGKALLILLPFGYLAAKVVPIMMTRVAKTQNRELFLMVALAIGLGTAAVTQVAGLSLALGAFLAGLIISQSDYAHETLARLLPLRDVFVALFFVTIGVLIDPRVVVSNHALLATMIGLIMIGKFVIWTAVVRLFGYPTATACLVGVGLTQIGEFSFVLVQAARGLGHVGHDVYNAVLAASLITILLNAALVRYAPLALTRLRMMKDGQESYGPARLLHGHVVICGYGRIGGSLGEAFDAFAIRYTVIERDPDIVDAVRARAIPCFFGDAAHHELLTKAGVAHAALVVLAIPDAESRKLAMRRVREINIAVPVVARAHTGHEAEDLLAAGATEVIQPEIEGATTLIRHTLVRLMQPKEEVLDYLTKFRAGRTE